jgi:hypothetical protein
LVARFLSILFVLAASSSGAIAARSGEGTGPKFNADSDQVLVSGTIEIVKHFGPPTFGERGQADAKILSTVIQVNRITAASQKPSRYSKREYPWIQVIDPAPQKYRKICGSTVVVLGNLIESGSANTAERMLIDVKKIVRYGRRRRCVVVDRTM